VSGSFLFTHRLSCNGKSGKGDAMVEFLNNAKHDNKGLTLIEIVVTIAIIGIVAVPLLNSFMVGMRTNNTARNSEDAVQMAQNLAEAFQTTDIDTIVSTGKVGDYQVNITPGSTESLTTTDADGYWSKYDFVVTDAVKGDANENYYLEATLKATGLTAVPDMVDVGDSGVIKIDDKYYQYDAQYKEEGYTRKTATLKIEGEYDAATDDGIYKYKVTLKEEFSKGTDIATVDVYSTSKILKSSDEQANIYLLCNYFDKSLSSTDTINIDYEFKSTGTEPACNVFLIQQTIEGCSLNPDKITITKTGGYVYDESKPESALENNKGLNIYSNVGTDSTPLKIQYYKDGIVTGTLAQKSGDTVSTKNRYTIYELEVKVREDDADGRVKATLNTTITE
jgi:prepilin-type N-terminal cleavage/methylation domain-containing protein